MAGEDEVSKGGAAGDGRGGGTKARPQQQLGT